MMTTCKFTQEHVDELVNKHEDWISSEGESGEKALVVGTVLEGVRISGHMRTAEFANVLFRNCTFSGDFSCTKFSLCTLQECKFGDETFLSDAQFGLCCITDTDFGSALNRTRFISCQVQTPDVS